MRKITILLKAVTVFAQKQAGPVGLKLLEWIFNNGKAIGAILTAIAAGYAAFKVVGIISTLVGAMKSWSIATTGVSTAQKLLNVVMAANPIGLIIAAIAA